MQTMTINNQGYRSGFADDVDHDFAVSAARYLKNSGYQRDEIQKSLVAELGLDASEASHIALAA